MWIDSHAHLSDAAFREDFPEVIERALAAGVGRILVPGCDLESSREAIRLAKGHEIIYAAVGIHPHDATAWNPEAEAEIRQMLAETKVVALGEIGLDYHYEYAPRAVQGAVFRRQLALAREMAQPVIIHSREACQDTLAILNEVKLGPAGGVIHCFTGSRETAQQYLELGLYLSLGGPLTFANAHKLREMAQGLPLERLLLETDCPYLAPHPQRGKRNEPALVRLVGERLAEIQGVDVQAVMETTAANARRLFGLD